MAISSSSKQSTLCPGDSAGIIIVCTTLGSALVWDINGLKISFQENAATAGQFYARNGYSMSLLRKIYNTTDTAAVKFISVLSIEEESSPDRRIQIGCHNGKTSTERFLEYHHVINGE